MHGLNRATGRMILVCFCLGLVLCCAQESMAQLDQITVSVSGGAGYLPLNDWEEFATRISSSHFEKDKLGSYLDFRVVYHFAGKHALALNVEYIEISTSWHTVMFYAQYSIPRGYDTTGIASFVVEWDFEAIPVGLSYEFYPRAREVKVSPFLGVGASYFFSEVKYKSTFLYDSLFENPTQKGTRDGEGYGVHAYVGVQSQLTDHLLVVSRVRARYADGMAFTDEKGDIKVEFTGVDFTIGLGWRF